MVQKALSSLPGGQRMNYLLQRRITHALPMPTAHLIDSIEIARRHVDAYKQYAAPTVPVPDAKFFEFGAGWDLHGPLTLFALGVSRQTVIDRTPHARAELVADVITNLAVSRALKEAEQSRLRCVLGDGCESTEVRKLAAFFGIDYRAPADARATGLGPESVDCVTSTSTFEHIPKEDIGQILAECLRIMRPHAVASFLIDYSDHYAHFDRRITSFNFLRYSSRWWRIYNSSFQFQNRLRHSQYLALFRQAGFQVVEERPEVSEAKLAALKSVPLARDFADFDPVDLATTSAHFVLRKGDGSIA